MKVGVLRPGILGIQDFLSPQECDQLIEVSEDLGKWIKAPIGRYQNNTLIESRVDPQLRDVEVCNLEELDIHVRDFRNGPLLIKTLTEVLGLPRFEMSRAMVSRYVVGSHIRPHRDTGVYSTNRLVTCVAYLNESYGGGNIEFPSFRFSHAPKCGECLCFYSEYLHGVDEIVEGTRYSIVWFAESDLVQTQ